MAHLSWILLCFEAFLGLKINLDKSSMLVVGNVDDIEGLTIELGCSSKTLPTNYLGLPLGTCRNLTYVWDGVEERFRKKLAIWKKAVYFKRGKAHTYKKYPVKLAHLHNVPISASKGRIVMLGEDQTRFPLGWWESRKENTPGQLGHSVLLQRERWAGHPKTLYYKQGFIG